MFQFLAAQGRFVVRSLGRPVPVLVWLLLGTTPLVRCQDWDVYLSGTITDAETGLPIPFAELDVVDQMDTAFNGGSIASVIGAYTEGMYTSATADGGYYLVEFKAPEYRSRMAVIDVSNVDSELDLNTAWRIRMDVGLTPATDTLRAEPLLGYCSFDRAGRTLRWATAETRKAYPVARYLDKRIAATIGLVDSVYRQAGTMIDGQVTDHWTGLGVGGTTLRLRSELGFSAEVTTDLNGYYATTLPYDHVVDVVFEHPDKVSKRLQFDLRNIPASEQVGGFRVVVDVGLFAPIPGEDLDFLKDPMGVLRYDPSTGTLAWDLNVSKPILARQQQILVRHAPPSGVGRKKQ